MTAEPDHRPELDGLRGAAAWIVVLSHVSNTTGLWGKAFGVGGGQLGVMLFFVLSGYLMGAVYLDQPFDLAHVRAYAVRRVARVVPLYYAIVLASFVLMIAAGGSLYPITPANVLQHLAFVSGVSVFWTIPIEIHFYILFAGLWWLYRTSAPGLIIAAIVATAACFVIPAQAQEDSGWLWFYLAFFLSGVLVSRLPRLVFPSRYWSALFAAAVVILILIYPSVYMRVFGEPRLLLQIHLMQMWRDPLYLATAVAVLLTAFYAPFAQAVLGNGAMKRSGDISYSIYLLHMPVIDLLARSEWLMAHPLLFLILTAALTALIATIAFRFIERPTRRFIRKRWDRSSNDSVLAPAESARQS